MMKAVVYVFFALFCACVAGHNDIDEIVYITRTACSNKSIDLPCPKQEVKYEPKGPHAKYFTGEIRLWSGTGWGVHDFKQNGPIQRTKCEQNNRFIIPLLFSNITFKYDYHVKLTILNNAGTVTGRILNLNIPLPVTYSNGVFALDYIPTVEDTTKKSMVFTKGGWLEDLIFNNLPDSYNSVIYDLLCKVYIGFYAREAVKELNAAAATINMNFN